MIISDSIWNHRYIYWLLGDSVGFPCSPSVTCLYPHVWFCIPSLPVPTHCCAIRSGGFTPHSFCLPKQGHLFESFLARDWSLNSSDNNISETSMLSLIQVELGQQAPKLSECTNRQAARAQWLHSLGKWAKNNSVFISGRTKLGLIYQSLELIRVMKMRLHWLIYYFWWLLIIRVFFWVIKEDFFPALSECTRSH